MNKTDEDDAEIFAALSRSRSKLFFR